MKCMVNASKMASRALDHGVPLLQRSSGALLGDLDSGTYRRPSGRQELQGGIDQRITLRSNLLIPSAEYTLQPAQHWSLRIPRGEGYSRVTSPPRRFGHWQIKHALINPKSLQPLLSPEWLDAYGKELIKREKVWKKAETDSRVTWATVSSSQPFPMALSQWPLRRLCVACLLLSSQSRTEPFAVPR